MLIRVLFGILILVLIDLYVFSGVKFLCRQLSASYAQLIYISFWSVTAICAAILLTGVFYSWDYWPKTVRTYAFALIFVIYFSKLFIVLFLIMDDLFRFTKWIGELLGITDGTISETSKFTKSDTTGRSKFLVQLGMLVASIPFVTMIYGMIKGKYDYQVKRVNLDLPKLPASFQNFKIVQISDLHTGSFMNNEPLEKAVKIINDLQPDVIFFTGDLVNNLHSELKPYKDTLSKLKARHGVFSVLGNHDYGDYHKWKSLEEKRKNLELLIRSHGELGWDILLDENRRITVNNESISVIGVQNWSARGNFSRYGDLNKALKNIDYSPVNILLSHDPSHWRAEIAGINKKIDLTLSGHTHGFQFGIEIPGFKWSPVQYMYNEWADLYEYQSQYLYVNRGLGFLGYPGRVGILPEITLFNLNNPSYAIA